MEKRGYLGIDESNHGRSPEFFAGVFSYDQKDIVPGSFSKKRGNVKLEHACEGVDFRAVIITERFRDIIGQHNVWAVVLSELARSYNDLEEIIVDGILSQEVIDTYREIMYPRQIPKIKSVPKADITYGIVNKADHLANLCYRNYFRIKSGSKSSKLYESHLIKPNERGYALLSRPFRKKLITSK